MVHGESSNAIPNVTLTSPQFQQLLVAAKSNGNNSATRNLPTIYSYQNFMNYQLPTYKGIERPEFGNMEIVDADEKVKYATGTLSGGDLTWWTAYAGTVGWTAALAIPWETLKTMLAGKYCPRNQVQKFEVEFWELRMKNLEVEEYNNRFLELATLCPSMVTPDSKKIEKYIIGLLP
ncbi:uncharacterized protein [Rutidosis leptorrhynchoides]|uniref:uncharacterized protein n=1 Tax=Rutidosis leptorrhynchoides TaxID=125765 RepID=UPI003A9973DE